MWKLDSKQAVRHEGRQDDRQLGKPFIHSVTFTRVHTRLVGPASHQRSHCHGSWLQYVELCRLQHVGYICRHVAHAGTAQEPGK